MDRDKNASRKRSVNFQLSEIRTLVDLVLQYKDIIENKKSDAATWQEKKNAWAGIATKFNATSRIQLRTAENLRLKYECLKKELRKKAARKKKSIGLLEILTLSIQGLSSIGDSDDIEKCDGKYIFL
ncbi:hypothetical protein RI129_002305 [Pyrocoelia pectoralis]|uniref:Regulatory protein zeste n=1 Tax=Pyrocoelia pectoralis TaxID=417401 RepID=A0AAN7VM34_9COLE